MVAGSAPQSYEIFGPYLAISWEDGHESLLPAESLRAACPCAMCKGEPDLFGRIMRPGGGATSGQQNCDLRSIREVGHYALQLMWGDGHSDGIYSFSYLRSLCDCNICREADTAANPG